MPLLGNNKKELWRVVFGSKNPMRVIVPVIENKRKTIQVVTGLFAKAFCVPAITMKKVVLGKRWWHVIKCKRMYLVIEGYSGKDWVELYFGHGVHKRTRGIIASQMFRKRREIQGIKHKMKGEFDLMSFTGGLWEQWCVGKKKGSFKLLFEEKRKIMLQNRFKAKLKRARNESGQ